VGFHLCRFVLRSGESLMHLVLLALMRKFDLGAFFCDERWHLWCKKNQGIAM